MSDESEVLAKFRKDYPATAATMDRAPEPPVDDVGPGGRHLLSPDERRLVRDYPNALRRDVLHALAEGSATVTELAERLEHRPVFAEVLLRNLRGRGAVEERKGKWALPHGNEEGT